LNKSRTGRSHEQSTSGWGGGAQGQGTSTPCPCAPGQDRQVRFQESQPAERAHHAARLRSRQAILATLTASPAARISSSVIGGFSVCAASGPGLKMRTTSSTCLSAAWIPAPMRCPSSPTADQPFAIPPTPPPRTTNAAAVAAAAAPRPADVAAPKRRDTTEDISHPAFSDSCRVGGSVAMRTLGSYA
jgi:hypothetical protein